MSVKLASNPSYLDMLPTVSSKRINETVRQTEAYRRRAREHAKELEDYHISALTHKAHRGSQLCPLPKEGEWRSVEGLCPPCEWHQPGGAVSYSLKRHLASCIMIDMLNEDYRFVKSYLDAGVNPDLFFHGRWHGTGVPWLFKLALEKGADVNVFPATNLTGEYQFQYMLDDLPFENREEILELLLEKGAICSTAWSFLDIVSAKSATKLLKLVFKNGVDITRLKARSNGTWYGFGRDLEQTVLNACAYVGTPDLLEFLISRVPELLNDVTGALWPAIHSPNKNPDKLLYLLRKGGEPDRDMLAIAVKHRDNGEDGWADAVDMISAKLGEDA
ncbi:hypothetical protein BO78DRAFT_438915 [Aspergillus sclerotiicarbonarius CBS 121057]|uniref:Ankyrin n=1 Tax=Aspergillus sclerotiicarbonarius (strain CBS 121057 / IBT 28362) TaxID=1448318 RepID=A0A319EGE8_ASPSB|nr:hypothetical protein BO78DRAFT_438915 [Aspergillus sclerotiicarbonarius CBS 121057]